MRKRKILLHILAICNNKREGMDNLLILPLKKQRDSEIRKTEAAWRRWSEWKRERREISRSWGRSRRAPGGQQCHQMQEGVADDPGEGRRDARDTNQRRCTRTPPLIRSYRVKAPWPTYTRCALICVTNACASIHARTHAAGSACAHTRVSHGIMRARANTRERWTQRERREFFRFFFSFYFILLPALSPASLLTREAILP